MNNKNCWTEAMKACSQFAKETNLTEDEVKQVINEVRGQLDSIKPISMNSSDEQDKREKDNCFDEWYTEELKNKLKEIMSELPIKKVEDDVILLDKNDPDDVEWWNEDEERPCTVEESLKQSLKEVKLMREDKLPKRSLDNLLKELEDENENN